MGNSGARLSRAAAVVYVTALGLTATSRADAFDLKHTQSGLDVRWAVPQVSFVVDPELSAAVDGAADAVADAAQSWSGAAGAPTLSVATGPVASAPAVDGTNSILFLHSYGAANGALAITIVSVDESTGYIVDTDIVINADHAFAVLPAGARASSTSPLVSTEGSSSVVNTQVFDLTHVTAHEIGHALGLADESANVAALMYPYTRAGDASVRTPGSDDLSGIDEDYAGADLASGSAQGCGGGASVAGRRAAGSSLPAVSFVAAAAAWLALRRRRAVAPCALALVAVLAGSGQARSAPLSPVDATARVTSATTRISNGVFQTTLDLVPRSCHLPVCPDHAFAQVWGGTMNGITQRVGASAVPSVNDEVDVAYRMAVEGAAAAPTAVVLATRPVAARLGPSD
jgi:Matrixin